MNICIVNTQEFNPYIGGVESVSYMLAEKFISLGHQVIFVSQYHSRFMKPYASIAPHFFFKDENVVDTIDNRDFVLSLLENFDIEIVLNQAANIKDFSRFWFDIGKGKRLKLLSAIHFSPYYNIKATASNFFITGSLKNNIGKWIFQIPMWLRFHLYQSKKMYQDEASYYKEVYNKSDAVIVLSKEYILPFAKMVGENAKIFAINNPAKDVCDIIEPNSKKKQILYLGRLEYGLKRTDRLIGIWERIFKFYPDWKLVIVGDGYIRSELEQMVCSRHIDRIEFTGFQEPQKYVKESRMLCMVSTNEGFPMVLFEAMGYGCVPIAYDSFGALEDIIENGKNGFRILPFKEEKYIEQLRFLMDNEDIRLKMAECGKETILKFSVERIAKQWIALFQSIEVK